MGWIRPYYLDASAVVKLLISEDGSDTVRNYFHKHTNFYTTSLCLVEALVVLKAKYVRKEILKREYFGACDELMALVSEEKIVVKEVEIANRETYRQVENLAQKYGIDICDAFQVVSLKQGFHSTLTGKSKPILITCDSGLAGAARKEALEVWNPLEAPKP